MFAINAHTRLVTLLGYPVEHSRSPLIHNTAFQAQGLNHVYVATPVVPEALPAAVAGLRAMHFLGANVTLPHKQGVRGLMDTVSARAAAVGAVNTIVCQGDGIGAPARLYGDNTDVPGFLAPLAALGVDVTGTVMVVLGAGGAARAVVYALLSTLRPQRLTLVARRTEQAEQLASDFAAHDTRSALVVLPWAEAGPAVRSAALVVNTTPVGMHPNIAATPWPAAEDFSAGQVVYDLIYTPEPTRLLQEAALRGATVLGGMAMLISQAAASYVQWAGREMPTDVVRAAVEQAVKKSNRSKE